MFYKSLERGPAQEGPTAEKSQATPENCDGVKNVQKIYDHEEILKDCFIMSLGEVFPANL